MLCNIKSYGLTALLYACGIGFSGEILANGKTPVVTIEVLNVEASKGQLIISVFSSQESFLQTPYKQFTLPATSPATSLQVTDLTTGLYSISVIHDEDADGELGTNFVGIPNEPVGFSNDATGLFGPPDYRDTLVDIEAEQDIKINLRRL